MNAIPAFARPDWVLARDEDFAAELIERLDCFRLDRLTTLEVAEEAHAWLWIRINALLAVLADERKLPRILRDQDWLSGAEATLDRANLLMLAVSRRRADLRRAGA